MSVNGDDPFNDLGEARPAPAPSPPPIVRRFNVNVNLVGHTVDNAAAVASQLVREFPALAGGNVRAMAGLAPAQLPGPVGVGGPGPSVQPQAGPPPPPPAAVAPNCKICFQPRSNRVFSECGHFVCHACITEWLRLNPICPDPLCRRACPPDSVVTFNLNM